MQLTHHGLPWHLHQLSVTDTVEFNPQSESTESGPSTRSGPRRGSKTGFDRTRDLVRLAAIGTSAILRRLCLARRGIRHINSTSVRMNTKFWGEEGISDAAKLLANNEVSSVYFLHQNFSYRNCLLLLILIGCGVSNRDSLWSRG